MLICICKVVDDVKASMKFFCNKKCKYFPCHDIKDDKEEIRTKLILMREMIEYEYAQQINDNILFLEEFKGIENIIDSIVIDFTLISDKLIESTF